jgi:hypothetical protein
MYRVYWRNSRGDIGASGLLAENRALAWAAELNRDFPNIEHWVEREPDNKEEGEEKPIEEI